MEAIEIQEIRGPARVEGDDRSGSKDLHAYG